MCSHARASTDGEEQRSMKTEPDHEPGPSTAPSISENRASLATLVQDSANFLPSVRALAETHIIVLLTPVIIPTGNELSDPFEPLGRSLAKRHSRIRHVPYVPKNGITSTHLAFIKRGHVVILCLIDQPSQPLALGLADTVFAAINANPCVLVVCSCPEAIQPTIPFPTVIRITGHAPPALEAAAGLIFGEPSPAAGPLPPRPWTVEPWNEARDIASVLSLWTETVSSRFSLDHQTFAALLRRPGYSKHYVVRDRNETVLGFCATYLSYADRAGENLIASLAVLLVRPRDRNRGVGSNLHAHALAQLRRTRGVVRYQLGSTFPRLLYGPPLDSPFDEPWFRRRGWSLPAPRLAHDLLLLFSAWRPPAEDSKLSFRACTPADGAAVLALVDHAHPASVDQYAVLLHSPHVADILLAHTDHTLVAAALTYSASSPLASTLPWAARAGDDIAGVSCICISPPATTAVVLAACVRILRGRGMRGLFLDGVSNGLADLKGLGFTEWAAYRDVWMDA